MKENVAIHLAQPRGVKGVEDSPIVHLILKVPLPGHHLLLGKSG